MGDPTNYGMSYEYDLPNGEKIWSSEPMTAAQVQEVHEYTVWLESQPQYDDEDCEPLYTLGGSPVGGNPMGNW